MIKWTICLIIACLLLPPSNSLHAQAHNSKLVKLSAEAEFIFTGKVISQSHHWNEDKSRIYTDVAVEVEEYLKGGDKGRTIIIRHFGGEVDGIGELYSHTPKFKDNEQVLLFAKHDQKSDKFKLVQGEEGKITIYKDKATGKKLTSLNMEVSTLKNQIKSYVLK